MYKGTVCRCTFGPKKECRVCNEKDNRDDEIVENHTAFSYDTLQKEMHEKTSLDEAQNELIPGWSEVTRNRHERAKDPEGFDRKLRYGEAQVSDTGSLRYNAGKPEVHEIPYEAIQGMAEVFAYGREKYEKYNWAKGNNLSVPFDSAQRHMWAFWGGEDVDKESGLHHLKHALTNLAIMIYYTEHHSELDDRMHKVLGDDNEQD